MPPILPIILALILCIIFRGSITGFIATMTPTVAAWLFVILLISSAFPYVLMMIRDRRK